MEEIRVDTTLESPLSVQDQALFDRVWQRVMSERPQEPDLPEAVPLPVPLPPQETAAQPLASLGPASLEYAGLLRERLNDVHTGWHAYQSLSRRTQGQLSRQLRTLAADQQQSLRQLGAACFLLTGDWFHPRVQSPPPTGPIPLALREMFLHELRWREAFARADRETRDPCLKTMFRQMEEKAEFHQDAIRRLLEGLHT